MPIMMYNGIPYGSLGTETVETGDSVDGLSITRSKYTGAKAIIPFGYDSTTQYKLPLASISDSYFSILAQNARTNEFASGVTMSFYALTVY